MNKSVIVFGYYNLNLGDDLFMKVLKDKLKGYRIDFLVPDGTSNFYSIKNGFNARHYSKFERRIDRITYAATKQCPCLKHIINQYDMTIILGGSLFIEGNDWKDSYRMYEMLKMSSKKIYIIGCNFGPFHSSNFLGSYHSFFKDVDGITVRDNYSKKVLNLDNINVYPDFVFNLDYNAKKSSKKILGVSVIDLNHRDFSSEEMQKYYSGVLNICHHFQDNGYLIRLFSFCEAEGDQRICEKLALKIKDAEVISYKGNVNKVLALFGECNYIVATRFHAVILGWNFGIPTLPIVYSQKTKNVINDLNPNIKIVSLKDANADYSYNEDDYSTLDNLTKIKEEAAKHLKVLENEK